MAEPKKISLSLGGRNPEVPRRLTPLNGTKRPHAALHDSDDEDEAEGKHEEVTHFDVSAGGAVHAAKKVVPKELLVIPAQENSRKRQRSGLPTQNADAAEAAVLEAKAKAAPITFGLNVGKRPSGQPVTEQFANGQPPEQPSFKERTVDELALDALLGKQAPSDTVIPALTEEEIFERDYQQAPDAPTVADYDRVPIEEFGAAMLRGMGWKDGQAIGHNRGQQPFKPRTIERRAALLGVGATSKEALGIELGEWGKHAKKHEKKLDQAYAPVILRNKKTGEEVTEDELKAKLKEQEEQGLITGEEELKKTERSLEYRSSKSSRRNEYDEDPRKDRDKEKRWDRDDTRDYKENQSSRRERSSSVDSRRRRKDDNSDHERRKRRRRDKECKYRDRSPSTENRHKSSKYDEKRRDRDHKSRDEEYFHRKEKSDKERRRDYDRRDR